MARRETRVVLLIPWDDEDNDHPAGWGFTELLETVYDTIVVDFEEVYPREGEERE